MEFQGMNPADARDFAERWLPAWTGNDPERLVAFYTDDVYYSDPAMPAGVRGRDALLVYFRKLLARNPAWVWTQRDAIPMHDGFVNLWHASIPAGTGVVEVDGLCTVQLRGDRIYANRVFFDRAALLQARAAGELPDIGTAIGGVLQRVAREEQPLLIATAERLAAARYRVWAQDPAMASRAAELHACAVREEDIASRVEALFPRAAEMQRALLARHPELEEINRTLFASRALRDQLAIQARGERLGAATWRAFARHAPEAARPVFETCAELEEASARVLEAILADGR
jgi:hypothetical protein